MSAFPLKLGEHLTLCDRCSFKRYASQLIKTWDGFWVCGPTTGKTCFETRHPQDFVRAKPDDQRVSFTRPQPTDTFRSVSVVAGSVGVQETTIPSGTFTTNNETL